MASTVASAVSALAMDGLVVVVDEARGESYLVVPAEQASTATVAFAVRHTSGFLCVALTGKRARELGVPRMVYGTDRDDRHSFLVSVDARDGITTGISAHDRAVTIRALADRQARAEHFVRPGHVMPIEVRADGVVGSAGPAEAAVELCRMAGSPPVALVSALVTEDALHTLGPTGATRFAQRHRLPVVTVAELVRQRTRHLPVLRRVGDADLPMAGVLLSVVTCRCHGDESEQVAVILGDASDAGCLAGRGKEERTHDL